MFVEVFDFEDGFILGKDNRPTQDPKNFKIFKSQNKYGSRRLLHDPNKTKKELVTSEVVISEVGNNIQYHECLFFGTTLTTQHISRSVLINCTMYDTFFLDTTPVFSRYVECNYQHINREVPFSKNPTVIKGLKWPIIITDKHIAIGCQCYTPDEWSNFTKVDLENMSVDAPDFWKIHKRAILALAKEHHISCRQNA